MADRQPLGSNGYSSVKQLAMVHNGHPPAENINEITNFPDIDIEGPGNTATARFDMSGMDGMKLG
jgi:hypothetical protein